MNYNQQNLRFPLSSIVYYYYGGKLRCGEVISAIYTEGDDLFTYRIARYNGLRKSGRDTVKEYDLFLIDPMSKNIDVMMNI